MRTKISWNPVVGYTGRREPCHKYSLAGAKSSPVDTRSRFSLLPLSIWYSISLRDRYLVGPVLEHGACGRRVFMWLAQVSQGAWVPHSVYWFTCATHWYMRSHHQDRTDEYFTAKYLSATLAGVSGPLTSVSNNTFLDRSPKPFPFRSPNYHNAPEEMTSTLISFGGRFCSCR